MIKPSKLRILTLFSLLLFVACGEKEKEIIVEFLAINQTSAEREIGETLTLIATVIPFNATHEEIIWTSSNPIIASVSSSGLVTALSEGNAIITAVAGGKTASCSITVVKKHVAVSSISLNKTSLELVEGGTESLVAFVVPNDATDQTVTWTSSNNDVVTVNEGVVTAIRAGEATVTAKAGDKRSSCKVVVIKKGYYSGIIGFSEGVELMCLIFRLMGAPEYQESIPIVSEDINSFFAPVITHEAIAIARECRRNGVSYDAVAAYGLHLLISEGGEISFNPLYDSSDSGFNRWPDSQKSKMLFAINDFYQKSNFHEWYLSLESLRRQAIDSFRKVCIIELGWYNRFFGPKDDLSSQIVLSFLIGNNNYGLLVDLTSGGEMLSPVIGMARQYSNGTPYYNSGVASTLVHEFSHPYCNPLITKYWEPIKDKAEAVYKKVETQMKSMSYGTAKTMMFETFVRASTIRYLISHESDFTTAYNLESLILNEEAKGFLLVRSLVAALEKREMDQTLYPTMEDFMPELIKAINSYDTP